MGNEEPIFHLKNIINSVNNQKVLIEVTRILEFGSRNYGAALGNVPGPD